MRAKTLNLNELNINKHMVKPKLQESLVEMVNVLQQELHFDCQESIVDQLKMIETLKLNNDIWKQ